MVLVELVKCGEGAIRVIARIFRQIPVRTERGERTHRREAVVRSSSGLQDRVALGSSLIIVLLAEQVQITSRPKTVVSKVLVILDHAEHVRDLVTRLYLSSSQSRRGVFDLLWREVRRRRVCVHALGLRNRDSLPLYKALHVLAQLLVYLNSDVLRDDVGGFCLASVLHLLKGRICLEGVQNAVRSLVSYAAVCDKEAQ